VAMLFRYFIFVNVLITFLLPSFAGADLKTFIKEYTYHANEIDSKASCRVNALVQVKRLLLEEIGTYLVSRTDVKSAQVAKDEITILTAGIVKTRIEKETWDGTKYWLRAAIQADPDDVNEKVEMLRSDWDKTDELKTVQKQLASVIADNEKLKKKLQDLKEHPPTTQDLNHYNRNIDKIKALDLYTRALAMYHKHSFSSAIELFQKSIDLNPDFPQAHEFVGRCFFESGQKDLAKRSAKDILTRTFDPADSATYAVRGYAYHVLNKETKAVKEYTMGIKLNPKDDILYRTRSNSLSKLRRVSPALEDINTALALKPKDYRNYMIRGVVHGRNKRFSKAMADFKKALQMNPKSGKTYFLRGNIYRYKKDLVRAKQDFEKACRLGFYRACKESINPATK
jgi:tetratricopeptide (TPR) repeat protein